MHSPSPRDPRRDAQDIQEDEDTLQDTLDAFTTAVGDGEPGPPSGGKATNIPSRERAKGSKQSSIDGFVEDGGEDGPTGGEDARRQPGSRALEGIALEMCMERVALREAANGITRDELLLTIARECEMPLEVLELVDSYLGDLELEGRLRRVGDLVVLPREGDSELLSMDLSPGEFIEHYRRMYRSGDGGSGG